MGLSLSLLYRGPLSSCNYGCAYCPFAKRQESAAEIAADTRALTRFVDFVAARTGDDLAVFFTPWGEALVRGAYRRAVVALSRLPHVRRVAVQTNLSCDLDWLEDADPARVGLWATYHPEWTTRARFRAQCARLDALGVGYSVGAVGFRRFAAEIEALRAELPAGVYLWINAVKDGTESYAEADVHRFTAIDPLFPMNAVAHPSQGRSCRTGESVLSVDGDGTLRRCHFVLEPIGNLYEPGWEDALRPRPCPNATCGCHIGYVHLDFLELDRVFAAGILERVPKPGRIAATT